MKIQTLIRDAWITAIIYSFLPQITHKNISFNGFLLALAFGIGYGMGFALNNYYDATYDAVDEIKAKNNFFVNNSLNRTTSLVLLSLCIIYIYIVGFQFGYKGVVTFTFLLFILWSYSAEPIKFKRRVGFDIFIHAIFVQTTPYLFTLFLLGFTLDGFDYFMIILLLLISISGQL
ncbi:MAG: hypothetical protein ACW99A_19550, partial [Candidatus Kariarchaeaceae archaeon]